MSIVIRMSRTGRTNQAHFRLGVYPKRSRRDGPAIELLGHYSPRAADDQKIKLNLERLTYWAGQGAEITPAVRTFLNKAGMKLPAAKSNKPNARRVRAAKARTKAPGAVAKKPAKGA